jgi:YVTN family beta-propeller protein
MPSAADFRRRRVVVSVGIAVAVLVVAWAVASTTGNKKTKARATPTTTLPRVPAKPIPIPDPANIYAAAGANMLSPAAAKAPYRIYVPESADEFVDVIDPTTMKVIEHFKSGLDPQHVVPGWDMQRLFATNDMANSLTPIDPITSRPSGPNLPVTDPYNMYFTLDGTSAIVVSEAKQRLDFRDPHTFELQDTLPVACEGVDHIDFAADGTYLVATCEFAGKLVKVDVGTRRVIDYLTLDGSSPQDIKLDPAGKIFYVADMKLGGVHLIDAATFKAIGFIPTGKDAHGLYPSRDARFLYVSNRGAGSVTVIDFATRQPVATWVIPGGGSPDMGGVSPDGSVLWLSGRYSATVYAISTADGHLIGSVHVPHKPHGLCVWPQPGRFSLGHTGITR